MIVTIINIKLQELFTKSEHHFFAITMKHSLCLWGFHDEDGPAETSTVALSRFKILGLQNPVR